MKHKKVALACLIIASCVSVEAKYTKVSGERSFDRLLDKNELVVVMFYHEGRDMRDQLSDFKSAARGDKYVTYVSASVDDSELASLASTYGVKQFPSFVLFRNGRSYSQKGQTAILTGERSSSAIRRFVRNNFQDYIDDIIENKREARRYSSPSVSFGVGYGAYPYYGGYYGPYYGGYYGPYYGGYYGGSGVSFGFGF